MIDHDGGLDRYFPIVPTEQDAEGGNEARERCVYGGRAGAAAGLRPGAEYKMWHWRDVDGGGGAAWGAVVGRATRVAGVDGQYLGGVLGAYEARLVQWTAARTRRGRGRGSPVFQ